MATENLSRTLRWPRRSRRNPAVPPPVPIIAIGGAAITGLMLTILLVHFVPRKIEMSPTSPIHDLQSVRYPTDQSRLLEPPALDVFQAPASGKVASALFGSARTGTDGKSRFHEGIDIAPLYREKDGRPVDSIFAIADGTVAYINRSPGNSSYGIYVVLTHQDPVGEVYSLYGHMATVESGLKEGRRIVAGQHLGRMGNTSTLRIPVRRSHLHFEIGLIANRAFARRVTSPHGLYNGLNLFGIDPIRFFRNHAQYNPAFSMANLLDTYPVAFSVALRTARAVDFFDNYPLLWLGDGEPIGIMVIEVAESGLPLRGRPATAADQKILGNRNSAVLKVDKDSLGRNGRHLLSGKGNQWKLTRSGREWLQSILYLP